MSSDSSSSDDEFVKLKEAIDENFLTDDLFAKGDLRKKCKSLPKPKSLRSQIHKEISINPLSIKVTPEFQRHVSKHLSKLLDGLIDDSKVIFKKKRLKSDHLTSGIKLLSSSNNYLKSSAFIKSAENLKKFPKEENLNLTDYEKRAKDVAVTPEWVLSQEETKHWAPSKGKVEIVKLDNFCNERIVKHQKHKV